MNDKTQMSLTETGYKRDLTSSNKKLGTKNIDTTEKHWEITLYSKD